MNSHAGRQQRTRARRRPPSPPETSRRPTKGGSFVSGGGEGRGAQPKKQRPRGLPVPRAMTRRAKRYLAHKIHQAKQRGAKRINADAARFAIPTVNIARLAKQMLAAEKAPEDSELVRNHMAEWAHVPWS